MPGPFTIPPTLPAVADALANQRWRARFSDAIDGTQNAAQALAIRGGCSQSWSDGMQSSAAGMNVMGEIRVPRWEFATTLRVVIKHTASIGSWALQESGGAAPAGAMFGVGTVAMLWMVGATSIAHTETTIAIAPGTGYVDFEFWRNNMGQVYSLSLSLEPATSPLAVPTTGTTASGYEVADGADQGDPGDAARWHREVDNTQAHHALIRCWSAWFSITDRAPAMGFPPPMIAMPVWVPEGALGQAGTTVRVWVKLKATDADPVANPANCDVLFGYPSGRVAGARPGSPAAPGLRWGRFVDFLATDDAAGKWLDLTFEMPPEHYLHDGMPGGYVNVSNDEGLVNGQIESISVWVE